MPTWWRYNPATHIFEHSLNEGTSWAPPPLNASIINEGIVDPAHLPPATPVPPNIAFTDVANIFTEPQKILDNPAPLLLDIGVADKSRLMMTSSQIVGLSNNLNNVGGAWLLDDPTKNGFIIQIQGTQDTINFYKAVGPNPNLTFYPLASITGIGGITERYRPVPLGNWIAYTPTWKDINGVVGSIGNGTLTGAYMLIGNTVFFAINFMLGSTSVKPPAQWAFTCPPVPFTAGVNSFGSAWVYSPGYDTGTVINAAFFSAQWANCATVLFGTKAHLSPTIPFTWATNSHLYLNGWYPNG